MPFDFAFRVLMPLISGALSLAFIAIGLYQLIRKRPFIIAARWMLALVILAFSPMIFSSASTLFDDRIRSAGLGLMSVISLATFVILVGYMALLMRGYMVFGTTQDSFRDAIVSTLSNLNLKSEETLSTIRIPSLPAELQVAVQGWIGTGQLRLRGRGPPGLLADIARGMDAYFNSAKAKTNMTSAVSYLIFGVLMAAMVVTMLLSFRSE